MKYLTVKASGIIIQIAKKTNVKGYTVGVIEAFLPEEEEMIAWSDAKAGQWIADNNKRMEAICKFMNDNKL